MILREIDFLLVDVPEVLQKQFSAEDESLDYYEVRKKVVRHFTLMTQCMASMISRLIPKITTKDFRKIIIECVDTPHRNKISSVLGVLSVEVPCDTLVFWKLDAIDKKKYALGKIREALKAIAQNNYLDVSEIEKACDRAEELNYVNEWYWKKPLKRKNMSVQVKVLHEVECVTLSMVFTDSATNSSKEVFLVSDLPSEWVYSRYFGKLEWVSDDTARLTAKTGQEFIATYK